MPNMDYTEALKVADGYRDCIVTFRGFSGTEEEWHGIGVGDFSAEATATLARDCTDFLFAAAALHPDSHAGLADAIDGTDLGWRFFTTRQGLGLGYHGRVPGGLGRTLSELAERYPKLEVAIINGEIVFL